MHPRLVPYHPPFWAKTLNYVPKVRATLAMTNTPIHEWRLPGTPDDFKVYIKREDMTGGVLTGNKVRKLEFILGEAIQKSYKHIITTGGLGSNHCRATAAACVELGLTVHLLLTSNTKDVSKLHIDGNLLINKLVGANMHVIRPDEMGAVPQMEKFAAKLEEETGDKALVVVRGGSDITGIWGYIQCFEEIKQQGVEFDDLVCVCGSGGMMAGLAIANYLNGSPYKIHGIRIIETPVVQTINEKIRRLGINDVDCNQLAAIHEDYIGLGYARSQPFELEYIARTAAETGIILDPTYTGKGAYGLSQLIQNKPEVFKGRRVLFIHSGGLTGMHSRYVMDKLLPYATTAN